MAMGRPKKEISREQLAAICRMNPTKEDVAAFFDVSVDTIEKRCKQYDNCTFTAFRHKNMVHTRFSLIRNALKSAEAGNTALMIFCLKNLCGWADKVESDSNNNITFDIEPEKDFDE